jgi:hypothetical protein
MSSGSEQTHEPSEEELRAAYEAQIKQIRIEHVLLEDVVTLINLGMRRTGLVQGTEEERDPDQVRLAIEAVRAVLPVLEQAAPSQVKQVRDALSQLQLAYVRIGEQAAEPGPGGGGPPGGESPPEPVTEGEPGAQAPKPGEAGPAQRSGRLWVPGQ